ncbi:PAS domain-containing protein [Sphingomicrobium clamense]|uniref:PAS domain-containing protein n=1 Tax=Sphingomicrobium clamense TaxID=2851013 RepID=A0ABS6V547_9SPHN|nr:hypothetical protein [Sphingomicrobium sp. B8]MBW0144203.1 hypothetical protein [Sphingomicrobium sp. B8]
MDSYSEAQGYSDATEEVAPEKDVSDAIGTDERRMHVRAYNYWASLLDGRDFPSLEDLQADKIEEFGPHSVILDFSGKLNNPATPYVGKAIKEEIGVEEISKVSDVPGRSLLSRLTDHHFQIIATRAPVGFEAEFTNQRGHDICYRGILMPFSSDGKEIDFVYGVINWKDKGPTVASDTPITAVLPEFEAEREDEQELLDMLRAEEERNAANQEKRQKAMAIQRDPEEEIAAEEPVPSIAEMAGMGAAPTAAEEPEVATPDEEDGLADWLCAARESAEVCKAADGRSRAALYKALSLAYDFSVAAERRPEDYEEILGDAGVTAQARAPMTPIVKLVFGVDYDKARLTEFAAALSYAHREKVEFGMFAPYVEAMDGGLKGMVAEERKARRGAKPKVDKAAIAREKLRQAEAITLGDIQTNDEFALVVTRRNADGSHEVVARVIDEKLLDRALIKAAR